jgi:lipoprotein NlpD
MVRALLVSALMGLAGCAGTGAGIEEQPGATQADFHVVRAGETLYGIAARYGLDHRDIARWNRLGDGSLIYPGQRLRLRAGRDSPASPATGGPDAPPVTAWQWPTAGQVMEGFRQSARTAAGILIGGHIGQPVVAAAGGEVVYSGSGLPGYGQLVIVRHNPAWLSAYGHNQQLLVKEGERVRAGAEIARMGEGPGRRAAVHFEIRRNGEPVDPLDFLPRRP